MKTHPTFIERYSLPIFLILTPLISLSLPLLPLPPETLPLLIALIPALMGIILAALLKKLFQWRVGLKWYLIALSMALVLRLTMSLLALLLGWIPAIQFATWGPAQNFFVFFNGGMTSAESLLLMTAVTAAIAIILTPIFGPSLPRSPLKEAVIANTT